MPENPVTPALPADLPENWQSNQIISPGGTEVGLTEQHGYNYLMQQVNAAQGAANDLGVAFSGLNATQIPVSADEGADDVAAALSKKAPGGYGLGSANTRPAESADQCVMSGWWSAHANVPNAPDGDGGWWMIHVTSYNENYVFQTAYSIVSASSIPSYVVARRYRDLNGWHPWEYVTPPLNPGVEYRTTERYNGKPVYVKLVDFGALPNNSAKMVEYAGGDTTTRTIEAHGVMTGGYVIPGTTGPSSYPTQVMEIYTSNTEVGVITHADRSSFTAQIAVKYWRTSD